MHVHRLTLAATLMLPLSTIAQDARVQTVGELRQAGGSQLTAAEAATTLTGAKVESIGGANRKRTFENTARGTLYATSASQDGYGSASKASGDWSVREDGAYCVKVNWNTGPEEWCRFLLVLDNRYFLAKDAMESTKLWSIGVKR